MFEDFLEIAYEAEVNTEETPELLEFAEEFSNEYQATRASAILELRQMIFDLEECLPYRTDDEFLLRFLRAMKFVVRRAYKLVLLSDATVTSNTMTSKRNNNVDYDQMMTMLRLVRHCNFREQHKQLYEGVDLWSLAKAKYVYQGTLMDRPDVGRLAFIRFGTWEPNSFPLEDLISAGMALIEIGSRTPKLQILGTTIIIDLEDVTLRHIASFTPTAAYQVVCLLVAMPAHVRSCHVINYSWLLNSLFFLFKRFIPRQAWPYIHFHGNDVKSLQQHIDIECLPPRYGGTCKSIFSYDVWSNKIKKYRDEKFDKDMKRAGYVIKE